MFQIEQADMALIRRLYSAAKTIVRDAEESPEGVLLYSNDFRTLEMAVNFLREREIFRPLMEEQNDVSDK
jgi:hypothetical protein